MIWLAVLAIAFGSFIAGVTVERVRQEMRRDLRGLREGGEWREW